MKRRFNLQQEVDKLSTSEYIDMTIAEAARIFVATQDTLKQKRKRPNSSSELQRLKRESHALRLLVGELTLRSLQAIWRGGGGIPGGNGRTRQNSFGTH